MSFRLAKLFQLLDVLPEYCKLEMWIFHLVSGFLLLGQLYSVKVHFFIFFKAIFRQKFV